MVVAVLLGVALAALYPAVLGLNNGVGLLPEMGFNSWYAIHNHLVNYTWEAGKPPGGVDWEFGIFFTRESGVGRSKKRKPCPFLHPGSPSTLAPCMPLCVYFALLLLGA